jgi:O-antigen/teichoic acid export membrane protein
MEIIWNIVLICFVFAAITFILVIHWRIKDGRLKLVDTYSYKRVIRVIILHLVIVCIVCLLIYFFSGSIEASMGIGALLFFATIGGCLFALLLENHTAGRGGRKID